MFYMYHPLPALPGLDESTLSQPRRVRPKPGKVETIDSNLEYYKFVQNLDIAVHCAMCIDVPSLTTSLATRS